MKQSRANGMVVETVVGDAAYSEYSLFQCPPPDVLDFSKFLWGYII